MFHLQVDELYYIYIYEYEKCSGDLNLAMEFPPLRPPFRLDFPGKNAREFLCLLEPFNFGKLPVRF